MAIEVFNRYEKKYRIRDDTYHKLRERLAEYMEADEHSRNGDFYTICNIYYDTPDNYLIRKSSYGVKAPEDKVFLEIKKKYKRLVNKRRTKLVLAEAYQYMQSKERPELKSYMNSQVLNEIDYMIHRMDLSPKVFLSYDRCAMFGKDNKDFRVTFDYNVLCRMTDISLCSNIYGEPILPEGKVLMELKCSGGIPLWMAEVLSREKIYKTSFSKYGTAYARLIFPDIHKIKATDKEIITNASNI